MVVDERPLEDLIFQISKEVQAELAKHPGKWAAYTQDEVIAIRDTSDEAYKAARELGYAAPILAIIPDGKPKSYYY